MPAHGYEFYLRVVNLINTSEIPNELAFQRHNLLCNHNDGDLFQCEYNMLSSSVKI